MAEWLAKCIVLLGAGIGIVFWYLAFRLYSRMQTLPGKLSGSAVMAGRDITAGMKELVSFVATHGRAHIVGKTPTALELKLGGADFSYFFVKIAACFESRAGAAVFHTEADFQKVDKPFKIVMAVLVFFVMPLAILGIPLAVWLLAVPASAPAVRWQVVQVVQIVNFIWEPFVLYAIHRRYRMMGQAFLDNVTAVVTA
ncbi:MAG: hypothetical protein A2521_13910 [Deltaproteobacteria bacterium RIFOXYD12_FULL_57_12]|nr:MAG: hypothetical protein A2521_13910 [Deltaproteobacteria bacterium RIFOXYD12_FULL_57_12]